MTHSQASHAWATKDISSDVPPGKRALALRIQQLCRHLSGESRTKRVILAPTQAQAAKRIGISEASLSRFLSGISVPAMELLERMYASARKDAGSAFPPEITLTDLRNLRERANADHCDSCVHLRAELEKLRAQTGGEGTPSADGPVADAPVESAAQHTLSAQLSILEAQLDELAAQRDDLRQRCDLSEAEIDRLRQENTRLGFLVASRSARRAGSAFRPAPAAATGQGPLPVPRQEGDRQRSSTDERAAMSGPHGTSPPGLTPSEPAAGGAVPSPSCITRCAP